jgi:hypothetical protein
MKAIKEKNQKVAIVVPHHRNILSWNEIISLKRCKEVFHDYDVILTYPESMKKDKFIEFKIFSKFLPLEDKHFSSEVAYNNLLIKPIFYKNFLKYEFILIYQLDTFIFENNLLQWCNSGYDYIGAPWSNKSIWLNNYKKRFPFLSKFMGKVGNGGLSLRRVKKFYLISIILYPIGLLWKGKWHEDIFWSWVAKALIKNFKIPTEEIALKFSFEQEPKACYELNNNELPFGCHAWEKFDVNFWSQHLAKYGYEINFKLNEESK